MELPENRTSHQRQMWKLTWSAAFVQILGKHHFICLNKRLFRSELEQICFRWIYLKVRRCQSITLTTHPYIKRVVDLSPCHNVDELLFSILIIRMNEIQWLRTTYQISWSSRDFVNWREMLCFNTYAHGLGIRGIYWVSDTSRTEFTHLADEMCFLNPGWDGQT